jgi:hypothetical protein
VPKVNVYLPDRLADSVRDLRIPLSEVCQRALELEVAKRSSTAVGSGNLIHEGLPVTRPHKCELPSVDTTKQPWTILSRPVGVTAKWECASCRAAWVLGFDGKWSLDLAPLIGAVVDLFRGDSKPRRTPRLNVLQPTRTATPT